MNAGIYMRVKYCPIGGCPIVLPGLAERPSNAGFGTQYWSDPSSWINGTLPGPQDNVTVFDKQDLVLDINANVANIYIWGTLRFEETDINLVASNIHIFNTGKFMVRPVSFIIFPTFCSPSNNLKFFNTLYSFS